MTAEPVASLNRFESEHVPKNFLPFALNSLSSPPVAPGVAGPVVVEMVPVVVVVGAEAPGWHCEYHSFSLTQDEPESQVVPPVQPLPPPANGLHESVSAEYSPYTWIRRKEMLTLAPHGNRVGGHSEKGREGDDGGEALHFDD